jgi:CYTH domain-containing protein
MKKIEIERKFLLKSMPQKETNEFVNINQYYLKNDSGIWERARTWESNINDTMCYIHTIKTTIGKGINMEDEKKITEEEFNLFKNNCLHSNSESRFISKQRWLFPDNELIWEVDVFKCGFNLIVAEVELPKKDFDLNIPKFIKDVLIMEVTGIKEFNNRSLAVKL